MRRILLAAAALSSLAVVAPAGAHDICNERQCAGVQRCYYWSDYPTCIYPWPLVP